MSAPNLSSLLRSKNPLSHLPEFTALKSDVGALQRRAGECETCERRVDALERQRHADAVAMERKMRALSDAFRLLSDVVVSELESLRADARAQRHDLDVVRAQMRWTHGAEASVRELRAFVHENVVREGARRERRDAELSRRVETAEIENARRGATPTPSPTPPRRRGVPKGVRRAPGDAGETRGRDRERGNAVFVAERRGAHRGARGGDVAVRRGSSRGAAPRVSREGNVERRNAARREAIGGRDEPEPVLGGSHPEERGCATRTRAGRTVTRRFR